QFRACVDDPVSIRRNFRVRCADNVHHVVYRDRFLLCISSRSQCNDKRQHSVSDFHEPPPQEGIKACMLTQNRCTGAKPNGASVPRMWRNATVPDANFMPTVQSLISEYAYRESARGHPQQCWLRR